MSSDAGESGVEVETVEEDTTPAASGSILASVKASLGLLTPKQRRLYWVLVAAQASLAFLDLGGVFLLGLVAYLATASLTNSELPPLLLQVVNFFGLEGLSRGALIALVAVVAAVLLMGRTLLSLVIYRWTCHFLAKCQAQISTALMTAVIDADLTYLQNESSAKLNYAVVTGPGFVVTVNLSAAAAVIAELTLFLILTVGLALINPLVTVAMVLFFTSIAYALHKSTSRLSLTVGQIQNYYAIDSYRYIQETLMATREITVGGRRSLYQKALRLLIEPLTWTVSRMQIISYLPKVAYEFALVVGVIALVGWEFWRNGPNFAAANIAVFLAASARLLPALQRTSAVLTAMRSGAGQAEPTYRLAEQMTRVPSRPYPDVSVSTISTNLLDASKDFSPRISLKGVYFAYPKSHSWVLRDINLNCAPGSFTAIVGKTGAGKSTLVDLMLGMVQPERGSITIAEMSPAEVIAKWPGGIGYVPQSVALFDSSVRENIALGLPADSYDEDLIWRALKLAHLDQFIAEKTNSLDTLIGERGVRLSGGQRQRLGLARALFTKPKLLVLDEATSSIDTETEHAITSALQSLAGETTLVTIAHRLSTVRQADQVVYMEDGRIVSLGKFEEVRLEVPQFERQAQLAGL